MKKVILKELLAGSLAALSMVCSLPLKNRAQTSSFLKQCGITLTEWAKKAAKIQRAALNVFQEAGRTIPEACLKKLQESCLRVQAMLNKRCSNQILTSQSS